MKTILDVKNLCKSSEETQVLINIDFKSTSPEMVQPVTLLGTIP